MLYTGIDLHKKYSVACTQDATGQCVREARIDHSNSEALQQYFDSLGQESRVVIEACWNWGWLHDQLEELDQVSDVTVVHPGKTRIIAEAQIKTDRIDARALCNLLRADLVARIHIPSVATRARKNVLRQRLFFVRLRTMLRNRVHALIDRQRGLKQPVWSDLFGVKGLGWLRRLEIPGPDGMLLRECLSMLDAIALQVKELEQCIAKELVDCEVMQRLLSMPGLGPILAAVIAIELDGVERFRSPAKLCAYAGLVPTTHASGGKIYNGRLLPFCNRYMRWAFIEAAWTAMGCDGYFGDLYRVHRNRGKKANIAITIVAHRMCQISWHLLHDHRNYQSGPVKRVLQISPATPAKT
jgi:transposase